MCGRVTLTLDKETVLDILGDIFHIHDTVTLAEPSYNIAPTSSLLSVVEHEQKRHAEYINWGYTHDMNKTYPTKKPFTKPIINLRSETAHEKPLFKDNFYTHRCIILADSFYEWKRERIRRPFRFFVQDQRFTPLAGIYKTKENPNGSKTKHLVILTCSPNETVAPIHHRMPVILSQSAMDIWLNPNTELAQLQSIMVPYPAKQTKCYEVTSYVNQSSNNSIRCIEPAPVQQSLFD